MVGYRQRARWGIRGSDHGLHGSHHPRGFAVPLPFTETRGQGNDGQNPFQIEIENAWSKIPIHHGRRRRCVRCSSVCPELSEGRKGLRRQQDEFLEADSEPKRNFERTTVSAKARRLSNRRPPWGSKLPHKDAIKMLIDKVLYRAEVKAAVGRDTRALSSDGEIEEAVLTRA